MDRRQNKSMEIYQKKNENDLNENPNYLKLDADPEYQKVTINEGMVVENGKETFLAKIPGVKDSYFLCPSKNVFETRGQIGNNGKTYIAYISKNHRQLICDGRGKMKPSMDSKELLSHFDQAKRGFGAVKNLKKSRSVKLDVVKR